ncbi:MAG: S41 family peptidase, partial [Anaerolinea sp.]|nr:S41 family peptidase [Anaerolinea sp.]
MNFAKLRMRHFAVAALLAAVFVVGFALGSMREIGAAQGNFIQPAYTESAFSAFWQVFELIQNEYIEDVPIDTLAEGAMNGMLEALDDEYSGYMSPALFNMMNADLQGEIEGIGVVIRTDEETGLTTVVSLLEGSPAQAAGILPGDIFAAVDGEPVNDWSQLEIATRVRGPAGTDVTITMLRDGQLIDFTITRQRITIPNIETDVLEGDIAYIRLNNFTPDARRDLDQALTELNVNERKGLIFDLRDNPGGLLSSAIDVASAFVREGVIVTEWFGDDEDPVELRANGSYAGITVPIVVLVNEGSASASEIVAGAIQDYGTATLLGVTTFGKGTVQTWHPLVNGGGVRLTIANWLRPSGDSIHERGVTPDIIVEWIPQTLDEPDV